MPDLQRYDAELHSEGVLDLAVTCEDSVFLRVVVMYLLDEDRDMMVTRSELRHLALFAEELAEREAVALPASVDRLVYTLFMGFDRTLLLQARAAVAAFARKGQGLDAGQALDSLPGLLSVISTFLGVSPATAQLSMRHCTDFPSFCPQHSSFHDSFHDLSFRLGVPVLKAPGFTVSPG